MDSIRIAVVSGKLGAVDGVSLEVDKWIAVFHQLGHQVFTIAGYYASPLASVPAEHQFVLPEIRFDSEFQRQAEREAFPFIAADNVGYPRSDDDDLKLERQIWERGTQVANRMRKIVYQHGIDLLIAENTNAMPMTLLGAVAVHIMAVNNEVATIFHHHDFWWERSRFFSNRIDGLLDQVMPPLKQSVEHVVISSYAEHVLRVMKRTEATVIPNCEDFASPPVKDQYNACFREDLGFKDDDLLFLQPTRIVPRKRIEDSLLFVEKFIQRHPECRSRVHFLISLYQGDEYDDGYVERIERQAKKAGIPLHMLADRVAAVRGLDSQGRRVYTNRDVLVNADVGLYLPVWEGFGNALLEMYSAKLLPVVATYLVYKTDIKRINPRGVEVQDVYGEDGFLRISEDAVDDLFEILQRPDTQKEIVEHNFRCAAAEFSLEALTKMLNRLLEDYAVEIRASRRRMRKNFYRFSV